MEVWVGEIAPQRVSPNYALVNYEEYSKSPLSAQPFIKIIADLRPQHNFPPNHISFDSFSF